MCPSAPTVCSEPGGQRPVLSLSLDLINSLERSFRNTDSLCGELLLFDDGSAAQRSSIPDRFSVEAWKKRWTLNRRLFQIHFVDWQLMYLILILLIFWLVQNRPIDKKLTLVQLMTWCRTGSKPLLESMSSSYRVTKPQWVKLLFSWFA